VRKIKTVFFGDSFIGCPGLPATGTWPSLVAAALRRKFAQRVDLDFLVRDATAENTRGALERMQKDVQFEAPDIVIAQYGTNDSTHWLSNRGAPLVSQSAFRANLEEIIDRCRRFDIPRVIFVTNHCVALDRFDINGLSPDQNTEIYDAITRDVAARATCKIADVRKNCADIDPRSICQDDLIHVNAQGAVLYADTVTPIMIDVIEGLLALNDARVPEHAYN